MKRFRLVVVAGVAGVAGATILGIGGSPAWAHNSLLGATPGDESSLAAAPNEVTLEFAERLNPRYTTVAVTGSDGRPAHDGDVRVNRTRAVQALRRPLPPGVYTVAYRVVSVDGHPVRGSLTFTVSAASGSPVASASVPGTPAPSTAPADPTRRVDQSGSTSVAAGPPAGVVPAVVLALVGIAAGAGLLLWRRRRGVR